MFHTDMDPYNKRGTPACVDTLLNVRAELVDHHNDQEVGHGTLRVDIFYSVKWLPSQ